MAWMLDVHLYFTASFLVGGVHGLWRCVQLFSCKVVGRLVPAGSRVGYLLLYTVTSH